MTYRLPLEWLQPVKMSRIIAHWSAGAYRASELDKEHYHFIVEGSGTVVRGDHTIADNVNTADDDYAAIRGAATPARSAFRSPAWPEPSKARSTRASSR